jgi:hypothetical protein
LSNIIRAMVSITGTRPLLQRKFGPDAIPLEKQERTGVSGNDPIEWTRTCMVTADGQLYIKGTQIFSMIVAAAKNTKKGKASIQNLVAATLQVEEEIIVLNRWLPKPEPDYDTSKPVYIDVAGVVNPNTRSRNVRYRLAANKGWSCAFTILWDKTLVQRDVMQAVMRDAGMLTGLADGRKGGYGRFTVDSFEFLESEQIAA